jgi:CRP-like cAMP-binding protein
MSKETASPRNHLLRSLPCRQFEQIRHLMQRVTLVPRRILQHARVPIRHIYFIEEGLVSVLASADTRNAVEVWLIGREGVVGSAAVLGLSTTPLRYLVQVGGSALRISVNDLSRATAEFPPLRALLLDDLHTTLLQSSQSTACSLSHSFRQRLARWLLTAQDRSDRDEFRITQDLLARILGVRRATVSEAIKSLEGRGILARMRGLIKIRDRERLEQTSCRCYRNFRVEQDNPPRFRTVRLPFIGLPFFLLAAIE